MTSGAVIEPLSEEECLERLGQARYGRVVVVTAEGRPEIFPVNFVLHGRSVAFRTNSRTILERAPLGHVVFEADHADASRREAWDVVVSGEGADITDSLDTATAEVRTEPLVPWAPGPKDHWVSIVNPSFRGRRLYVPEPSPE